MDKIQLAIWHEYSMNHHGPGDLHAINKLESRSSPQAKT